MYGKLKRQSLGLDVHCTRGPQIMLVAHTLSFISAKIIYAVVQ